MKFEESGEKWVPVGHSVQVERKEKIKDLVKSYRVLNWCQEADCLKSWAREAIRLGRIQP